uniref:Uncharacterized protein n=1 Tax=Panagrolaimus superbus TaxID=310955 RepID=A0A914YPK2_9BILA
MAELTEEMREKLFFEIITSSKEYTKENITDPKRVKSGILSILRTHRPIKLIDYEYGLSHALMKDYQIIVKEKEDKSKVRVYCKNKKYFYCVKYRQRLNNCSSNLKFKCGILFAAIHHRNKCEAKDYSVVQKIQDLLKQGKNGKALALTFRKNESQNRSPNYDPFLSLSTSIRNDTTGSTPTDGENEMNLEEWFS